MTITVTVSALTAKVNNNGVTCRLIFNPYFKLKILRQINVRIVVSYLFIKYVILAKLIVWRINWKKNRSNN